MEKQNVTLSIPKELLRKAKLLAVKPGDIDFVIFATYYYYFIARNVNPYIVDSEP